MIVRRDRRAEDSIGGSKNLHAAAAGARPPTVVGGHSAHGDQPVDLSTQGSRKAIDEPGATASVVEVVAGDDEQKTLSVRIGKSARVDALDHVANLSLHCSEWNRRRIGHGGQLFHNPAADVDDRSAARNVFERLPRQVEVREDIRAERRIQLFETDIENRIGLSLIGGVVHEQIETAELSGNAVDEFLGIRDATPSAAVSRTRAGD